MRLARRMSRLATTVATLVVAMPRDMRPQSSTLVSMAAGSSTDERGITSSSMTLAPTLVLAPDPKVSVSLGANATRYEAAGWLMGGSVTVAAQSHKVAGMALTLNAGGGVSRSSLGSTFTVAEATPAISWSMHDITLFGGGRFAYGRTSVRTSGPTLPLPIPGTTALVSAARESRGPVFGVQWNALDAGARWPVTTSYREERGAVDGVGAIDRAVGLAVDFGRLGVTASAGERAGAAPHTRFASASASYALTPVTSLDAAVGRYPSDRLTGLTDGRFVAAGVSLRFGGASPTLPAPHGVDAPAAGMTRLSIRAEEASRVDLYGDWNGWKPAAAQHAENGVWYVDVPLSPGEYRYAFRVNDLEWRVPDGAVTVKDGFGWQSAYVTVASRPQSGQEPQEER